MNQLRTYDTIHTDNWKWFLGKKNLLSGPHNSPP